MPLRKEKVSLKFTNGIQGKVDHKILPKEHLTTLENGRFDKLGAINKRSGYTLTDLPCTGVLFLFQKGQNTGRKIQQSALVPMENIPVSPLLMSHGMKQTIRRFTTKDFLLLTERLIP